MCEVFFWQNNGSVFVYSTFENVIMIRSLAENIQGELMFWDIIAIAMFRSSHIPQRLFWDE